MGKSSNRKKQRRESNHSTIPEHKRQGKKLIPPFQQIEKLKKLSWSNDRLPENIWVALIVSLHEREEAIHIIKQICEFFGRLKEEFRPNDLSISSIGALNDDIFNRFLDFIENKVGIMDTLKPLALFESIPAKDKWRNSLNIEDVSIEWEKLFITVAKCYDHQSQEATDCRWSKLYYYLITGKLQLPTRDMVNQILNYPNVGDMRSVRPFIRSMEMTMDMMPDGKVIESDWKKQFWQQGLEDTQCWKLGIELSQQKESKINGENLENVKQGLKDHFYLTNKSTDIDAKHDTIFGLVMYCLEIIEEMNSGENNTSILSRMGLRTITECYITLAYLCHQDNAEMWQAYRVYGSGQAKLAFLKLEQIEQKPKYVDIDTLRSLAGEDQWEEFVEINLGHWESTNLRKMSDTAGVKEDYNSFYDWTSGFAHGQWAAVRNTTYDTCGNPMHRLHRIPKEKSDLNDVTEDAKTLCNKMLDLMNSQYPDFSLRLT
ncbi:DUF5677 domain-containing protein [Mangrovibacillus cuniculi]|uniref:Uncharacterized protein n=1 Tax=Mangrovibacillus cuniculi TaxID=2593652 RepID=A0A7S8CCB8_9BACI|nr:DUF5677 domain-containing protein [Mangrovibacillus cuniculi]QPC47370.1 hypothetical protein G8O30_10625 [Mangrovibacillus cuniculi]